MKDILGCRISSRAENFMSRRASKIYKLPPLSVIGGRRGSLAWEGAGLEIPWASAHQGSNPCPGAKQTLPAQSLTKVGISPKTAEPVGVPTQISTLLLWCFQTSRTSSDVRMENMIKSACSKRTQFNVKSGKEMQTFPSLCGVSRLLLELL